MVSLDTVQAGSANLSAACIVSSSERRRKAGSKVEPDTISSSARVRRWNAASLSRTVATLPIALSPDRLPVGALIFAKLGQDELLLTALAEAEDLRGEFPLPVMPSR
mgnify:CR=1 FL=1